MSNINSIIDAMRAFPRESLLPAAVENAKKWAQKNNGIVVAAGSLYMASAVLYELGIQVCGLRKSAQPVDLRLLAFGVRGREVVLRLELAHLLGRLEAFGKQVHECGVDVVDRAANGFQARQRAVRGTVGAR